MTNSKPELNKEPMITQSFVRKVTAAVSALLFATLLIYLGGKYWSGSLSQGGHTTDETVREVVIGQATVSVKSNYIRFSDQRRDGVANKLNLYASWPDFDGYQEKNKKIFNDTGSDPSVIFIDITKSNGQMDMSGRMDPIYRNFITSPPKEGPSDLIFYEMDDNSNFRGELIYTERLVKERPFVIKCLSDTANTTASATECQRDISLIGNLTVTYRYSKHLLPEWQKIEEKLLRFLGQALKVKPS